MAVQINVAANQAALTASIQAGVQAYNQKFAQNNQVNLSVNQRAFSQPLGRMTGDVKDFEAALAASNARVIAFGASTAVLGGVIRSFKELANVTIDVEKNLADINRVFGLTTGQLQKFSTDLFSVGKQTASTFDDASKAALEFSRQGLKAEEVLIRTKDALTLARVAGISTANSVDALTSTINGFAATGVTTTQILNKLVAVEQDFAVGAGDLAEALSRTGQAAQEAGVSLDQLNALVTAAQQSTARGGAVIGNALKTIFTRLQRTETLDQLEAFNIAVRDVQGNTLPAVSILQNFAGAYKNLGDAQRAQLSEQVAGVYQVNILKAIVGDLNKSQGVYAGALQRGASATNEAEVATAKLNQTLDALLKQTATSTQQLANNIGKVTFEPLARYGTEQLKSLVESMNEILEGEGVGSTFANGLLKGIRNVIAGPGAIAAFFTLFKLIQNSFTYLAQALPQIAGITTETQNRKNIEQSILQIMQQQGPVSQALAGSMGNQAAQAQLLLQLARQQTAEYQIQSTLAKQLATQLAGQGVRVKGSGGLQVTRAGGYIPAATRMAETVGAQAGGYAPGKVVKSPVGGVMNTAEDVKYVPGFAQPFINPPAGSKAGRTHRQNAISRTGVDPYMNSGFIPNFGNPKNVIDKSYTGHLNLLQINSLKEKEEIQQVADLENEITNKLGKKEVINDKITGFGIKYDIEEIKGKSNAIYRKEAAGLALSGNIDAIKKSMPANKASAFNAAQWTENLKDLKDKGIDLSLSNIKNLSQLENGVPSLVTGKTVEFGRQFTGLLNALSGEAFEKDITIQKKGVFSKSRNNARLDFESLNKLYSGGEAKLGGITLGNLVAKAIESTGRKYENGEEDKIAFSKSIKLFVPEEHKLLNKGFIPNFAPPISMLRIPWFKKYANPSFDAKQPTLNIAGAGAADTFRSTQFRTNKTDYNKKAGDGNVFGPIYEKFVRSSISLQANKSKIKSLILGQSLEPDTIQGESSFDSFMELVNTNPTDLLDLVGIEIKGGPKDSQTGGSATGIITKKYNNFTTKNPKAAARLRELLGVFNEPGNPQHLQYMSALGKEFLPLAATNYDEIAKNSPELLKVLSQKTNELLTSYVNNPSFYRAEASGGFIPNFASMISSSIKGKGNISAIKTGKNNYEIEGVEVGKKFRGQGLGSQLYGSIAQKIGSGSTIKSVLLPQEQALADYASGKSIPAKAIFPQLSWAKMAKSSKLLINGKEIAMSDFENGIAGHKYNAAKLDMALIELVNSHASGFIPNFAYKQAVMGLEESMSGEKAVFDNKPFPHIRNKSQPTFSSAIADHGGLGNALSDSMRGQKDAGLMSKGYIPNFGPIRSFKRKAQKNQSKNQPQNTEPNIDLQAAIQVSGENMAKSSINFIKFYGLYFDELMKDVLKSAQTNFSSAGSKMQSNIKNASTKITSSFADLSGKIDSPESKTKISNAGTTLAFAGPMAAGLIEQAVFGDRKRADMSATERQVQSGLSTGLTAASTGASIGAAFGPLGLGIGVLAGAAVGLAQSLGAASLSADELSQVASEYKSKTQDNVSTAQTYIETLKTLNTATDPEIIKKASESLAENFSNIKDVNLQEIFQKTGTDVKKLGEALNQYEKDRKKTQNEADEDTKAALATKAYKTKQLSELGYNKTKTIKGSFLQSDVTVLAASKENDNKILSDFKQTFEDLSGLTQEKAKQFAELVQEEKDKQTFDTEKVANFLKDQGVSEGISERLAARFDELEEDDNRIGGYLIARLSKLLDYARTKTEKEASKTPADILVNDFLSLKKQLTLTLSDSLIAVSDSIKRYESDSSIVNLISGKMKEINDSIYSSVSGNLSEMAGISVKSAQLNYTNLFQNSELTKVRGQTAETTRLKKAQNESSYEDKITKTIFGAQGGVTRSPVTMNLISEFISGPLNKSRSDFESFANSLGLSAESAFALSKDLEADQKSLYDLNIDLENNLKLKTREFDLTETANKINYETGLKQLELEKEKLKITYAQKDATLQLRKDAESYTITSAQNLELKKIDIGSEFRYLGSGKRETFASQQTDQKSIFDDEQKIAQKQAILDARKSIIEIATQEANINAQNTNTEAILALVDAIAGSKILEGESIMSSNSATQEQKDRGGRIKDQGNEMQARNAALRKSFNERKNTLSYDKLSDLGVKNDMSIKQATDQLELSKTGKDQSTVNAIDNTIQDLTKASETLGSNATVYAAKVAQAKADFEQSAGFVNNMAIGFKSLGKEADDMVDQLGRNLPGMFADGLVDGIKAAIRESDNLGTALMGIASKFLDEISTTLMKAGVRNILSGVGFGDLIGGMTGNQKGGYIRAQSGMYISGTGTGDKYPAMLENGEYVLNRNAVMAMGGPSALDSLNFSAAPRFASGGSFGFDLASSKSDQDNLANMEKYMTSEGLDNSQLYNELSDVAKQKAAEDRAKKLEAKKQKAAMIGSLVAAVATIAIGAGLSNMASNAKATKAEALAAKAQGPENLTKSETKAYEGFQKSGMINSYGEYAGPQAQTGFRSLTSKPFYSSNIYGANPYAPAFKKNGRQTGGLIGSRLSDTIPGYMEGGLYNSPMVKRYGTGMQSGGSSISGAGNSNSTVNNNTNANNSFNFNTSVQRDGSIKMGANTTSYQQQDVELSKNLNTRMYAVVTEVIRKEKQFGGSLAGIRN